MTPGGNRGRMALNYAAACLGRYRDEDGAGFLVGWANERRDFDATLYNEVCQSLAAGRGQNDYWQKPTVSQLIAEYDKRDKARKRKDVAASSGCKCNGTGWLTVVMGGDTMGRLQIMTPGAVEPRAYVIANMYPCACELGDDYAKARKYTDTARRRVFEALGYSDRREADAFAGLCRAEYRNKTTINRAQNG